MASEPITSLDIGDVWIADQGLTTDDGTRVMIRKPVGACLTVLQAAGQVSGDGDVNRVYRLSHQSLGLVIVPTAS